MSNPRNAAPAPAVATRTAAPLSALLSFAHPALWGAVAAGFNLAALALVIGGR